MLPGDDAMAATPAISAGEFHTIALRSDGTVRTWGLDDFGQLGTGRPLYSLVPVRVSALSGTASVSTGMEHVAALRTDGTIWTWGGNGWGQLGDGSRTDRSTPAAVPQFSGAASVTAGSVHTVARKTDGSLWAWGQNGRRARAPRRRPRFHVAVIATSPLALRLMRFSRW